MRDVIAVDGIQKRYGIVVVVEDVSFSVRDNPASHHPPFRLARLRRGSPLTHIVTATQDQSGHHWRRHDRRHPGDKFFCRDWGISDTSVFDASEHCLNNIGICDSISPLLGGVCFRMLMQFQDPNIVSRTMHLHEF